MARQSKWVSFIVFFLFFLLIQSHIVSSTNLPLQSSDQGSKDSASSSTPKQDRNEVHCSRERSRAAWKIIDEYLMPFVNQKQFKISTECKLHPDYDMFRDNEQHKTRRDFNEWQCGYCRKRFYEEKYIDQHFDNRHHDLLNVSRNKCLADVCGALHCDLIIDTGLRKSKCNPAAVARNKHLCETLADSCFPVNAGASASNLHEFFLRQFCDAHTCSGKPKPFSRGQKARTSGFYVFISFTTVLLVLLFYIFMYLYKRGMRARPQVLKRLSQSSIKKKPS